MKAEQIITSFEKGKKSVEKKILPIADDNGDIELNIYNIYPQMEYQKFQFFGGAITYAAGEVLSSVPEDISREIINSVFSPNGLQYRSIRTHIDSCDFSTQQYCALNNPSDTSLSSFSIAHDKEKIIPWIKAAYKAAGKDLPVMLTPWTPPEFMKTNESRIGGGRLKKEYYNFWAKYLCRYILEYRDCGIFVNSLSIQNEPNAVQSWDSCIFSPEEEKRFIADSLYPELVKSGLADIELFIWDHNKERAFDRACATIGNETVNLISGVAVHWYSGDHFDALRLIRQKFPSKSLVFTEGCIEYSRFDKNQIKNAQKYAHDIIGNFSAGLNASYDWNICLDSNGGPNYVGNYCEAPVMINKDGRINYNLSYDYIGHFSKYMIPGAKRIATTQYSDRFESVAFKNSDGSIAVILLNREKTTEKLHIRIEGKILDSELPAESISTIVLE